MWYISSVILNAMSHSPNGNKDRKLPYMMKMHNNRVYPTCLYLHHCCVHRSLSVHERIQKIHYVLFIFVSELPPLPEALVCVHDGFAA